jgi:hypothetical protein
MPLDGARGPTKHRGVTADRTCEGGRVLTPQWADHTNLLALICVAGCADLGFLERVFSLGPGRVGRSP